MEEAKRRGGGRSGGEKGKRDVGRVGTLLLVD
jgi:hypothetical protein